MLEIVCIQIACIQRVIWLNIIGVFADLQFITLSCHQILGCI